MIAAASSGAAAARAATRLSREQAPSSSGEMGRQRGGQQLAAYAVEFLFVVMISRYLKEEKKLIENPFFRLSILLFYHVLNR